MEGAVSALTETVTPVALWQCVSTAAPYIAAIVLFAFGYRIVKRMISGVSKGKAKV